MTRRCRRVWVLNHIFGDDGDLEVRTIGKERSKREQLNSLYIYINIYIYIINSLSKEGKNSAGTYPVPLQIQNWNSLRVGAGAGWEVPGARRHRQTAAAAMQHADLGTPCCATTQIRD
jgi:hypothetical protein